MKVEHLSLTGDQTFGELQVKFAPGFNLIIGRNGAGKSRFLHAIGQTLRRWTTGRRLPLLDGRSGVDAAIVIEGVAPDGEAFSAKDERRDLTRSRAAVDVAYDGVEDKRARRLRARASHDSRLNLPILGYASPERPSRSGRRAAHPGERESRLAGWEGAMDMVVEPKGRDWFARPVGVFSPNGLVRAVRPALLAGVPDLGDIRLRGDVAVVEANVRGDWVPWDHLPTSYRAMMGLIGELAWRAATLTGSWEGEPSSQISGVVLLEDLERHLDLNWQRRIVEDLHRAFPQVQFIATTHSPFVVQSVRPEHVVTLDRAPLLDFPRSSIEDIAETTMGVENVQRSARFVAMVEAGERYYAALRRNHASGEERSRLKEELDRLLEPFADNPAFVALLRSERIARGLV